MSLWTAAILGPVITAGEGWVGWEGSELEGVSEEPLANSLSSVPTQEQNMFYIRRVGQRSRAKAAPDLRGITVAVI